MTSIITSDAPVGQTHELPSNNLLTVRYQTAAASSVVPTEVTQVLFVDQVLGTATGPGTIGAPFQTAQQAITYAATLPITSVHLRFAPASYGGAIVIPAGLTTVQFSSWGTIDEPFTELLGDITKTGGGALAFKGLALWMANITVGNVAVDDLTVSLDDCACSAEISANNASPIVLKESSQSANITGTTSVDITTDGYSWRSLVTYDPTIAPPGYGRTFLDAGHAVYTTQLSATVPTSDVGFDVLAVPGVHLRVGDRVQVQVADPAVQDFRMGLHGSAAGSVTVWIENFSRVSETFNDTVLLTFHFNDMPEIPTP